MVGPGDRLANKYEIIRQLAVGGMAELYLARALAIQGFEKLVVIKRILPQYMDDAQFVSMFLAEARLAAGLHHPNIAQVFDIGVEQGDYFFSMEYVHGENLGLLASTALDNGVPLSLDASLTLVAGLCAGLHYAHEKLGPDGKPLRVVHRDVSPSNVLVTYDGAVKLVDFGIARATTGPNTQASGLKGKVAYMSPEQCRGKSLDRRSDLFSVGTILYELTTGEQPFVDGNSKFQTLENIVGKDPKPPSQIVPSYPEALERIVMRALAREPEHRYGTALELQGHLEDFAHESRLRVSPLVLARLMSTLFPARLEEWERARAQGAFFVEQTVVRTWIEKTGEPGVPPDLLAPSNEIAGPDAPTAIAMPLDVGDTTSPRLATPLPFPRAQTPASGMPATSAASSMPMHMQFAPAHGGTFGLPPMQVGDAPMMRPSAANFEETKLVRVGTTSRAPLIVGGVGLLAIGGIVIGLLLTRGGGSVQAKKPGGAPPPAAQQAPAAQPTPPPSTTAPAATASAPAGSADTTAPAGSDAEAPVIDPTPPTPPAPPAPPVTVPPVVPPPATPHVQQPPPHVPPHVTKPRPPVTPPAKPPSKPATTPSNPDNKETKWHVDDPFLPVRPGT
jgi:serine/threonine protein kinase|nr:serine/threonine-protein kinase [Kofleriaceae bacterium]